MNAYSLQNRDDLAPALIFLHGGPGFQDYLRPFFIGLEPQFTCIFYDQLQGNVKLDDLIKQLDDIVSRHPDNAILVGHSWGGILALEYAATGAHPIEALALMNTGITHRHWREDYWYELEVRGLTDASPDQIFLTLDERVEGVPFLESCNKTFSCETLDSLTETYLKHFDLTSSLATLKVPIVNIFSEYDYRFPPRIARTFRLLNSSLIDVEISGAGHFPFLRCGGRNRIWEVLSRMFLNPTHTGRDHR